MRVYYLTGGTPLTACYLRHRYSEDLDFFTEKAEVNLLPIERFLRDAKKQLGITKITFQSHLGLQMFFLRFRNNRELKVDFNYYPFRRIERGSTLIGVTVDSLRDIAVNKMQTIATRTNARDFVDLYFIAQETQLTFAELMRDARLKFDWYIEPVQFGKQFLKAKRLVDFPRMIKPLRKESFERFFVGEAKKLEKQVFKR